MVKTKLANVATARSGDKGNISDIAIFAKNDSIYQLLKKQLTVETVKKHFQGICYGEVERYEVPNVLALKFVLQDALGGGAASSLRMDNLGKSLSAAILRMEVDIPEQILNNLKIEKPV